MAEGSVSEKMDKAAENSAVKLLARAFMILTPLVGGYFGSMLIERVNKTNESTIRLEETMRNLIAYQLPAMSANFDGRFNAQAARIDDNTRRIGKLEDWRLTMPLRGMP